MGCDELRADCDCCDACLICAEIQIVNQVVNQAVNQAVNQSGQNSVVYQNISKIDINDTIHKWSHLFNKRINVCDASTACQSKLREF
jgi:iron only hydrogenase large subunit-like protein